jgi:GNAT superfamily N-acetyltransferase
MDIPEPVRLLALYPFRELPRPPDVEHVELDGAVLAISRGPNVAQIVSMRGSGPADVEATVESARTAARARGKTILAWWVPPDQDHVVPALESAGLVNEDTPGFEAVENALVLASPPLGGGVDGVEVRLVETWDDFRDAFRVIETSFGLPVLTESELRTRYDDYRHPDNPWRGFVALINDRVVGTSSAAFGDAGVNLFGGSVLPEARGQGVYRALVRARWEAAAARGTPALTGRMSRPICEQLGFVFLAPVRVFVDRVVEGSGSTTKGPPGLEPGTNEL